MSLLKYGIVAVAGYYLGQPQGRKQLQQLRAQLGRLGDRPEVKQLQDSARERAVSVKDRASSTLTGGRKSGPTEATVPAPFPPPPVGRTTPPSPTTRP